MQISLDISLYPLKKEYSMPILEFINQLETDPRVTVVRNTLSTQLFGDFHHIMGLMTDEMARAIEFHPESIFVLKLVGQNRAPKTHDAL